MLKISAFRAIENETTSLRYMAGHAQVLLDYGVTNITTNTDTWKDSPSVYGIIVENEAGDLVGGVRLHVTDGIEPLPVEKAVGAVDPKIGEYIGEYPLGTTGELCGLWNARPVAGMGVSMLLVRAVVAIASQVPLRSMFTFCSEYTTHMTGPMGFYPENTLGEEGRFYYPNRSYVSRIFRNPDVMGLSLAAEFDRRRVESLRAHPSQVVVEAGPKSNVEVAYDLQLPVVEVEKTRRWSVVGRQ